MTGHFARGVFRGIISLRRTRREWGRRENAFWADRRRKLFDNSVVRSKKRRAPLSRIGTAYGHARIGHTVEMPVASRMPPSAVPSREIARQSRYSASGPEGGAFHDTIVVAPLKHALFAFGAGRSLQAIPRLNRRGPIEAFGADHFVPFASRPFHDTIVVAPLKRICPVQCETFELPIPRHHRRGPIEANRSRRRRRPRSSSSTTPSSWPH